MHCSSVVLTIIGEDKPGLVERISGLVADHHANWLESRMARLSGQFAGILHVEVDAAHRDDLLSSLRQLETRGLQVTFSTSTTPNASHQVRLAHLSVVGHDRPGIVRQLSQVFAQLEVNVEELETSTESAPMSGDLLFKANAALQLPLQVSLDALRFELERVSEDLMVDITLGSSIRT